VIVIRRYKITSLLILFILFAARANALEVEIGFHQFPGETAELFRESFGELENDLAKLPGDVGRILIYKDERIDAYKISLILGLDPSIFGVTSHSVYTDMLDLTYFVPHFIAIQDYLDTVKRLASDVDRKRFIGRIIMSIMLINEEGDILEFHAETDFFFGVREAIISPNVSFEKSGRDPVTIYMEPIDIVSQVFILPPAKDESGALPPASLIYNFFSFEY
jgi:hypothetical protein